MPHKTLHALYGMNQSTILLKLLKDTSDIRDDLNDFLGLQAANHAHHYNTINITWTLRVLTDNGVLA